MEYKINKFLAQSIFDLWYNYVKEYYNLRYGVHLIELANLNYETAFEKMIDWANQEEKFQTKW